MAELRATHPGCIDGSICNMVQIYNSDVAIQPSFAILKAKLSVQGYKPCLAGRIHATTSAETCPQRCALQIGSLPVDTGVTQVVHVTRLSDRLFRSFVGQFERSKCQCHTRGCCPSSAARRAAAPAVTCAAGPLGSWKPAAASLAYHRQVCACT